MFPSAVLACFWAALVATHASGSDVQCRFVVAGPGHTGALDAASSQALCARLGCTRPCPHRCFAIEPPDAIRVPAGAEPHVHAVWPDASAECTPRATLHKRHAAALAAAAGATGPTDENATADYDVVVNMWELGNNPPTGDADSDAVLRLLRAFVDAPPMPGAPARARAETCDTLAWVVRDLALLRATACGARAAAALAAHPAVASVRVHTRPRIRNEFTVAWLEHDTADPTASGVDWDAHTGLQRWPTGSASALDGHGQRIGHADTGVDMNSAYFRDPDISLPPYVSCGTGGAQPTDGTPRWYDDRRKVVQYVTDGAHTGACGDAVDADGHGSHTAGTATGAAACGPAPCTDTVADRFDGHAPGAKLAVFDAGPDSNGYFLMPDDIGGGVFAWAYDAGARVYSASWGAPHNGVYSGLDYQIDAYAEAHPEMLVIVAAGNEGGAAAGTLAARAVTSPGMAKNVLTVGASVSTPEGGAACFCGGASASPDSGLCAQVGPGGAVAGPQNVAYFSSSGIQSCARRCKPDLVAPGFAILSARNTQPVGGTGRAMMAGTSMATPMVAGLAAVVRQYFAEGFWPCGAAAGTGPMWTRVSAALVKAVLIALAVERTGTQANAAGSATVHDVARTSGAGLPNPYQGYGAPQLRDLLRSAGRPLVAPLALPSYAIPTDGATVDGLADEYAFTLTGESAVFTVCIWWPYAGAASASEWPEPPRAVLVWTDPAIPPLSSPAMSDIVNDLDLAILDATSGLPVALGNSETNPTLIGSSSRTSPSTQPDGTSNVEVAYLRTGGASTPTVNRTFIVQVTASRILVAPQRFALVLAGGWGVCNATPTQRCEPGTGNASATPAPTAAPAVPPFDRYFLPGAQFATLAFTGTSRACLAAAPSCSVAADTNARVEAIAGFADPSALTAHTVIRVRSVPDPAALFADYPTGGVRLSWALRITLMNTNASGARLYVSLPALSGLAVSSALSTNGIVSGQQRLLVRDVGDTAAGWRPADADVALLSPDADRSPIVGTALRVTGSAIQSLDAVWALQQLPGDGDSATLCEADSTPYGCVCDRATVYGYESTPSNWWRPLVILLGAASVVGACARLILRIVPPSPSSSRVSAAQRRNGAYARVGPGGDGELAPLGLDDTDTGPHSIPAKLSAKDSNWPDALLVQGGILLVASARAETPEAQRIAWAGGAACVGAAFLSATVASRTVTAAVATAVGAALACGALGADVALGTVYADPYVLVACAGAVAATALVALLASYASPGSTIGARVLLVATALGWCAITAAHTARAARDTQLAVAASNLAIGAALFAVCVDRDTAAPLDDAVVARTGALVCVYVLATASYILPRAPCE